MISPATKNCFSSYALDIFDVCRIMTAEGIGDALDRLDIINNVMRYAEKQLCFDHTYEGWLQVGFHTSIFTIPVSSILIIPDPSKCGL